MLKPLVRDNVCLNAHPIGCAKETERQIAYIEARQSSYAPLRGPRTVLVLGCSTGYGLASRIATAFGLHATTVGVSFERSPSASKTGTPGWYANRAFDQAAATTGLTFRTIEADAFANSTKDQVIATARELGLRFDLVVYSLASPVRTDPTTGELYRSVIKPIGSVYRGTTVNVFNGVLSEPEVQPATAAEIAQTVKVMGGEDWTLWIEALRSTDLLAQGAKTVAYSYIGPKLSWPIYREGTIGRAKAHLEMTAKNITAAGGIEAYVSINKALVTRASAVIPVIPLYVSVLYKVMKERGIHEDCIAQIDRLLRDRLYSGRPLALDAEGRIRIDDLEMGQAVQVEVEARMARIGPYNLNELADVAGFRTDFLRVHGFEVEGVDYEQDIGGQSL